MLPHSHGPLRGFSIIEILISLTLMAILSGVGLITYSQVNAKQKLQKAVTITKATLKQAQQDAFLGKKPPDCALYTGTRVSLDVAVTPPKIQTDYICNGNQVKDTNTMTYDAGVTLIPPEINTPVQFDAVSRKTSINDGESFTFSLQVSTSRYTVIRILHNGVIQ